jgi:AraC-like DNA-binding protein
MPPAKVSEPLSPLLQVLQKQVLPWVRGKSMDNLIIAQSSWKNFQRADDPLPDGVYVTRQTLKSKRVPVKSKPHGSNKALVNATWPEDGLCSTTVPVLMFVVGGKVALPLGDYVVHCQSGHMVLMPPGTPRPDGSLLCVELSHLRNDSNDMFSLMPWGGGVECWLNHTRNGEHWTHRAPGENCHVLSAKANFYLETLTEEAVARTPHFRAICEGLLLTLIALLMREIGAQRAFQPVLLTETALDPAAPPHLLEQDPIARALAYINSHLQESLSIDRVAAHVFVSRAYFTRQFRHATGKTFIEYVTERRMEEAKVLLQDTNWSIEKISAFVGVTSAHLRSLFLQNHGLTPGAYRHQKRQNPSHSEKRS